MARRKRNREALGLAVYALTMVARARSTMLRRHARDRAEFAERYPHLALSLARRCA